MDVAAEVIGIRLMWAKLLGLRRQFVFRGGGRAVGFCPSRLVGAGGFLGRPSFSCCSWSSSAASVPIVGSLFGAAFIVILPIFRESVRAVFGALFGVTGFRRARLRTAELIIFGADHLLPDRRAAWPLPALVTAKEKLRLWPFPLHQRWPVNFPADRTGLPLNRPGIINPHSGGDKMKIRALPLPWPPSASPATVTAPAAFAQAKEQFFPVLVYRTGAYAANGNPLGPTACLTISEVGQRAGRYQRRPLPFEECEPSNNTTARAWNATSAQRQGVTLFQPLSTGVTFALPTDRRHGDKIR